MRALVYLDAFIPEHGQSVLDLLPAEVSSHFRNMAKERGGGWRLPAREVVSLMSNARASVPSSSASCIASNYPVKPFFLPFADKATRLGWTLSEADSGHDCHVEQPEAIAKLLLSTLEKSGAVAFFRNKLKSNFSGIS